MNLDAMSSRLRQVAARRLGKTPDAQGAPSVEDLRRLSGGASQETWRFTVRDAGACHDLILRKAPPGSGIDRRDGLAADLREARRRGEIARSVDCTAEASFLLAAMRGLMVQYLMDRSASGLAKSKALLLARLPRPRTVAR